MSFCISGTDVQINSLSDCDRTFDLDDHNIVTVQFYQKKSSENCKITITEHSSDDYPRMCIKPVKLDFNSCKLKIEVHKGLVIGGFEDEVNSLFCILYNRNLQLLCLTRKI